MSLKNELRNSTRTEIQYLNNLEFPENGDIDKAKHLAEQTVETIKFVLSDQVKTGGKKKERFTYFYGYSSYNNSDVRITNDIKEETSDFGSLTIAFGSWEAVKTYYTIIEEFLKSEELYREWQLRGVPFNSIFNKIEIGRTSALNKQADFDTFLSELHKRLKTKWDAIAKTKIIGSSDYISVREDYALVVKLFCDSKGVVK